MTVTSAEPLLNQANASLGEVISTESVANIPLNGRTPAMLTELSVGIQTTLGPGEMRPFDSGLFNEFSISGGMKFTNEMLLDGSPNMSATGELAFAPSEDSTHEVSVRPFDTDASFGHTSSGVINMITKGGTNELHGTASVFTQIAPLGANLYWNGRTNPITPRPSYKFNQYGLTVDGPVVVPKLFNGKKKLFFFFAWDYLKDFTPSPYLTTVPTDAEREGDFSALMAGGSSYQLYEPNTGTLSGGAFTRTPVPNNCLTNQSTYCSGVANAGYTINPIAAAYLKLFPEPNYTSGVSPIVNENNYLTSPPSVDNYNAEFGRLDYNPSARSHIFFDYRNDFRSQIKNNYFRNAATGTYLVYGSKGATLDDVITLNPNTLVDVRLNWTHYEQVQSAPAYASSPSAVGFPSYLQSSSQYVMLPTINFNSSGYQSMSTSAETISPSTSYQVFGDMVKLLGRHTLKFGFDGRQYRQRYDSFGSSTGSFTFANNFVTSGTSGSAQPFGGDLASFLLGLPTSGSYAIAETDDYRSYYIGTFVQDDWRVNNQLTFNLGLRFDIDTPWGDKFGRTESGFNPAALNTASTAAAAAFLPSTKTVNNTTVAVSSINTLGGLTFPSSDWGAPYQIADKHGFWSPRIGFSYNPAWSAKTVVHGGFGVFVMPQLIINVNAQDSAYDFPQTNNEGFTATTSYQATNNSYFTSLNTLSNPFPNGFAQPSGSSQGASTYLGSPSGISFWAPVEHDLYSERWNLDVQRLLTGNTLLEAIYMGNHGVHLPVAPQNINATEIQYLTTNPYRDQNLATATSTAVANPFAGLLPNGNSSFNGATTSLGNLLYPYPAYGSTAINEMNETIGHSSYNSAILHVEQRAQHGLTLTANYSFAKLIERDEFLNSEDTRLEKRVSPLDHTHHFAAGATYELPFGSGKLFSLGNGRLADEIAGGWVINGVYQFETGPPIEFSADIPFQPGMSVSNIHSQPRNTSPSGSGNPALVNASNVFVTGSGTSCTVSGGQLCDGTTFFNGQYTYHYRTLPTTISSVRADGFNNLDASILKNVNFTDKIYFQLRFETFNFLNHPAFAAPNVSSATSSTFGYITANSNNGNGVSLPRQVQIGGRLVF